MNKVIKYGRLPRKNQEKALQKQKEELMQFAKERDYEIAETGILTRKTEETEKLHGMFIDEGTYKKEIIDGKSTKKWVIDETGAKIVREIFDLCLNGKTYFQISTILKKKYPKVISSKKTDKETGEEKIKYRAWTDS